MSLVSAYYSAPFATFLATSPREILGALAGSAIDIELGQKLAWEEIDETLRAALRELDGWIYLEFEVPRLGSRIDAVLVIGPIVLPIEFKCGEKEFRREALYQAWDYALDLKNFHLASHDASIFPVLVATRAERGDSEWIPPAADGVRRPRRATPGGAASGDPRCHFAVGRFASRRRSLGRFGVSTHSHHHRSRSSALLSPLRRGDHSQ